MNAFDRARFWLFLHTQRFGLLELPWAAARLAARSLRRWTNASRGAASRAAFALRNLLLRGRPVDVTIDGTSIRLTAWGAVACETWSRLRFEHHELHLLLSWLRSDSIFFDVGANTGLFSLAAATRAPNGKVLAFEPAGATFAALEANLRLNATQNAQAFRLAFSDYVGSGTLQVNTAFRDGLNTLGSATHPDSRVVTSEIVTVDTLDNFVREHGIERVDVMKVDVEGAEYFAFKGGAHLLGRPDAPLILYEGYSWTTRGLNYHPVEIRWLLESYGYSIFVLDGETGRILPPPRSLSDAMFVAAKKQHPAYPSLVPQS